VKPTPLISEGCRLLRVVRGTGPDRRQLKELAAELACSIQFVALLLEGRRDPGLPLAVRIEELFSIPPRAWTLRASVQPGVENGSVQAHDDEPKVRGEAAE
jgi:hypothetical protein